MASSCECYPVGHIQNQGQCSGAGLLQLFTVMHGRSHCFKDLVEERALVSMSIFTEDLLCARDCCHAGVRRLSLKDGGSNSEGLVVRRRKARTQFPTIPRGLCPGVKYCMWV